MPCSERCKSSGSPARGSCSQDKARGWGQNLAAPVQRGGRDRGGTAPPQDSLKAGSLGVLERVQMRIVPVERANCHDSDHSNLLPPLAAAPTTARQGKMGFRSSSAARDSVLQDSTQGEIEIQRKPEIGRAPERTWTCSGRGSSKPEQAAPEAFKDGAARVSPDRTAFLCAEPELTLLQITAIYHKCNVLSLCASQFGSLLSKTFFQVAGDCN